MRGARSYPCARDAERSDLISQRGNFDHLNLPKCYETDQKGQTGGRSRLGESRDQTSYDCPDLRELTKEEFAALLQ